MPKQLSVGAPMRCAAAPASIVVVTLGSPDAGALGGRRSAVADFGACAWAWAGMAAAHRLTRPSDMVGACLTFGDGTTSRVFRETRAVGVAVREPVLLVIAFRLAFLDDVRFLHAAFHRECLIHTPLFAGFPGFRSKLWLEDDETRVYRGVYQWDGEHDAALYEGRMVGLLAPFSNQGTARARIIPGLLRADYLQHPDATVGTDADAWWRLAQPCVAPRDTRDGSGR